MDTPTSSCDASTSSSVVPVPMIQGKIPWPEAPSIVQEFSLPPSIMYYMAKNPPSPEVYLKMAMSCKYFFEKLPLLIVKDMFYDSGSKIGTICPNDADDCKMNYKKCCVKIDIKKLSSQIWLTDSLAQGTGIPNFTSLLSSKIYRSQIYYLSIDDPMLNFDDLKFLASTVTEIYLWKTIVSYSDGKPVMLETIFEAVENVRKFQYCFGHDTSMVTTTTLKNIEKLPNFLTLELFELCELPEFFDVKDLSAFIKKHMDLKIDFEFNADISDQYKNQLNALIDEILEAEVPNRIIDYPGQNYDKLVAMIDRYTFDPVFDDEDDDDEDDDDEDGEEEEDEIEIVHL